MREALCQNLRKTAMALLQSLAVRAHCLRLCA
jgi:hypothetical protein